MTPNGTLTYFVVLIVLGLLPASHAVLRCYVCNSVIHAKCDSPPALDYLVECTDSTAQPSRSIMTQRSDLEPPPESRRNYTFCRKTVAHIPHQDNRVVVREAETRVVRSCGWLEPDDVDGCKWGATDGVHREMCTCKEDKCNSAPRFSFTVTAPVLAVVTVLSRLIGLI